MCGAILEATDSSLQKDIPFCRSICMKKVMKLLAFTFEQPSYKFIEFVLLILLAKTLKKQIRIKNQWETVNFTIRRHKREPRGQPFPSR